ncbi:MAG: PIN domain-containing protein [Candidatus Aenigmarchaeota archaeon]|nr:PIN domain-containing protein [Candidatus Aenigmarchaeota archaeon]
MRAVFDTGILVDESRGYAPAVELMTRMVKKEIAGLISMITEGEMLSGKDCSKENVMEKTLDLLGIFTKINISEKILRKAAEFRRNYDVSLIDCIIAATAFHENCILWTKNAKDFGKIKEIRVEEPY